MTRKSKRLIAVPSQQSAIEAVKTLISYIGDDPSREGLKKTPERFLKAWRGGGGGGYQPTYVLSQQKSILKGQFADGKEGYSEMIAVQKIVFTSHCEHHIAQFVGTADVAYIPAPGGRILGLSKLVRVVDMFSKRLQVQERLTAQIADFIEEHTKPLGVGVVVRAKHSCMCSRGVKQPDTLATTSALRGEMMRKHEVRDEFLRLVGV